MDSDSSQETFIEHLLCSRTQSIGTEDVSENKIEVSVLREWTFWGRSK